MTGSNSFVLRVFPGSALAAALLFGAAPALADEDASNGVNPPPTRLRSGFAALDRPHGMIEGGAGILTLPGAEVCVERNIGCKEGDLSFAAETWQLFRANVRFAAGAGIVLGLIPTAHPPHVDPEGIEREQTRGYLTFEGALRYYPIVLRDVEWWIGLTGGMVVVDDRFHVVTPERDDRALLGPRGVSIRTEGGSVGFATGLAYELAPNWSLTGTLRYSEWFLPAEPATDSFGDEASLTGPNEVLTVAFGVGYRLAL
ncbi:MAG TPA: hypothetical protein VF103_01185 [Polyangiaceae bacterium]